MREGVSPGQEVFDPCNETAGVLVDGYCDAAGDFEGGGKGESSVEERREDVFEEGAVYWWEGEGWLNGGRERDGGFGAVVEDCVSAR